MTYDPLLPRVIPIFVYYIFISIFGVYVTIRMFLKWKERKVKPPLYLALVFLFLSISLLSLLIGLAEAIIVGEFREIYRMSLPIGYFSVILADIFLFIFASHMTNRGKKAIALVISIGMVIVILVFLPWNWWGVPDIDYIGLLNIRLYTTLSIALYSNLIYIYIAYISNKVKKNVDDKVMYTGLKLLFYSMIGLISLFVMIICDTILILIYSEGYSVFIYLAWGFGSIFIVLSYLSLIMPDWLVKRIKKKYAK